MFSARGSPLWECVGVWKSVRGLSLQDGALFSVLFLLDWSGCMLAEPPAELGTSPNICIKNKLVYVQAIFIFIF